jgi:hypothetical protein
MHFFRCVAIRDISTTCRKGMGTVGEDLDQFLTETPTRSEAEEWLKDNPATVNKPLVNEEPSKEKPRNEQEVRKCFQLTFLKLSESVQASD